MAGCDYKAVKNEIDYEPGVNCYTVWNIILTKERTVNVNETK